MSWTLEKDVPKLQEQIKVAANQNILMFAASLDQGYAAGNARSYPADYSGVFSIFSGNNRGHTDDPRPGDNHFAFPGGTNRTAGAILREPIPEHDTYNKYFGSSFATAVAAGFAALFLHCISISEVPRKPDHADALEKLRSPDKFAKLFSSMTLNNSIFISKLDKLKWKGVKGGQGRRSHSALKDLAEEFESKMALFYQ